MSETLKERVKADIRLGIRDGRYPVKGVLPSVTALGAQVGASAFTVRRALRDLAREGLVRPVQKRGTVVLRQAQAGTVCLLLSSVTHSNELLHTPIYRALLTSGFAVDAIPWLGDLDKARQCCARLEQGGRRFDCVVVVDPEVHHRASPDGFNRLMRLFPRRVDFTFELGRVPGDARHTVIASNHTHATRLVAEHLLALGHRRISAHTGYGSEEGTVAAVTSRHLRDLVEMAGAAFVPYDGVTGTAGLLRLIREQQVTAYWALNDHDALQNLAFLAQEGVRVPQDLALIGRHDTPWAVQFSPNLTSLSIEPAACAATVVEAVSALLQHQPAPALRLVQPRLVPRESTRPAPADLASPPSSC